MNNLSPLVKRVCAYLIDIIIVMYLSTIITSIPFLKKDNTEYQTKYSEYQEQSNIIKNYSELLSNSYVDNEITTEEYDKLLKENLYTELLTEMYEDNKISKGEYKEIITKIQEDSKELLNKYNYILGKIAISDSIITILVTLLYFGVLQYFTKGQTIGKKLLHLQVVSATKKELNILNFILRTLIINNVLLNSIAIIFLATTSKSIYLKADSATSLLVSIVEAITIFLVMTREDKRGMHDLLFGTKVISIENNIKTIKTTKHNKLVLDADYKEEEYNGKERNKQKRRKK